MDQVSVIIPTYNRFNYLMNTIRSVKQQKYENIEIIVVNDCSTQKEYYAYDWEGNGITILHLKENSKEILGYPSCGYVRNRGIEISNGKYIAFCDDDDIWFSQKIDLQLKAIKETNCKMSSTDGLFGLGLYDENKNYKKYNAEHFFETLHRIYDDHTDNPARRFLKKIPLIKSLIKPKPGNVLENGLPEIFTFDLLAVHNCIILSSVLIEKALLTKLDNFRDVEIGKEDHDLWLRALKHTDSAYVKEVCFYYDGGHGDGQDW